MIKMTGINGERMTTNRVMVTVFAVALLTGAAISSAKAEIASQNGATAPVTATKLVTITDPIFNTTAYSLSIPDSWIFQGGVVQGTSCATAPLPVFRVSAPDGLTGVKWFPRMDWAWSDDPKLPTDSPSSSCLPHKSTISAADFLKYMIPILKVAYLKDLPTPNLPALQKAFAANDTAQITTVVDAANFQVRYRINQIEIEEHVNAVIFCSTNKSSAKAIQHICSATLGRSWAPQGQWSPDTFAFTQNFLSVDQKWTAAVYYYSHRTPEEIARERRPSLDEGRDRRDRARFDANLQAEALRKKQYAEFMDSINAGTRKITEDPNPAATSSIRIPDDWCDYSLDKQKVQNFMLGGSHKDPPEFNYIWVNEKGDQLQTKNLNDNPNGNGTVNWTLKLNDL
jgi:hypothetical protein